MTRPLFALMGVLMAGCPLPDDPPDDGFLNVAIHVGELDGTDIQGAGALQAVFARVVAVDAQGNIITLADDEALLIIGDLSSQVGRTLLVGRYVVRTRLEA